MAGAMTDYLEGEILKHLFRTGTFAKPTAIAVSLASASPGEAGTGASHNELSSSGAYARVAVNPSDANWSAVSSGTTDNVSAITFPTATASWSATVTHCAILDVSSPLTPGTAANLWFHGALTASKTVGNGDIFKFNAGDLDVQIDS